MNIVYYDSLASTNDEAKKRGFEGAPHLFCVAAHTQTEGRGRLGRRFLSPTGGTYFSVVLRPTVPRADYGVITPICAVAVHRALVKITGVAPDIKWVNDLLLDGKKLCGILSEASTDKNGNPFVVLGIGINTGGGPLPSEIADIATVLPVADKHALIAAILEELSLLDTAFLKGNWRPYYRRYATFLGHDVTLTDKQGTTCARAVDIDERGGLVVALANGTVTTLYGGEISLRQNK